MPFGEKENKKKRLFLSEVFPLLAAELKQISNASTAVLSAKCKTSERCKGTDEQQRALEWPDVREVSAWLELQVWQEFAEKRVKLR